MTLPNVSINPILKRFLKGLGAAAVTAGLSYIASHTVNLNLSPAVEAVVMAAVLAAEKAVPQNF